MTFITLEGPEGGGKTSHLPLLAEFLRQKGYQVLTTFEPGGTAISEQIRSVLTSMSNKNMDPRTEILLFCAARAQLIEEVLRPRLAAGEIILSDRYADSTLAYQGYGHGLDLEFLQRLLNFTTGGLWPELTFLLDLDIEAGLARKQASKEWNRLDAYEVSFHRRVRQGYRELAAKDPQRWVVVDAARSFDLVQESIRQAVLEKLSH